MINIIYFCCCCFLPACAALLHNFGPVETRQFAESVIAVNYRPLHDLGVSQEEAGLWKKEEDGAHTSATRTEQHQI